MPTRLSRPLPSRVRAAVVVAAVGGALLTALVTGPIASAASGSQSCTSTATTTGTTSIQNGEYIIQDNEWNSSAEQCITYTSATAWSVTTANFNLPTNGAPATYPSIYKGCHWGLCTGTNDTMPIQVSNLASATTSWSTTQPSSGAYDVAYDIWFNSTPTTKGQPDGTELMIWLNSRGGVQPFGGQTATANIDGDNWNVWTGQQTSWKIISYVLNPGGTSFSNLDVKALIKDAVGRGSINPAHYLIDAEAGFEIWQGGQGLGTNSFSWNATAGSSGGGGDTAPPTAPTNVAVTGTTASSVGLSWSPSADNVGVTGYDVYRGSTLVGTTAGTTFTDTGLTAATQYGYTVRAFDAAGNLSAASGAVTATTSASGGGGGTGGASCTATYSVTSQWSTGFTGNVTVTNTGTSPTKAWQAAWTWPGNQQVTQMWNATGTQSGQSETATSLGYDAVLGAGQSTSFGFQASYSGGNGNPMPTCAAS